MSYAENTTVPVEKSKVELDGLLRKHGATQRAFAEDDEHGLAVCVFTLEGRQYRLHVPLPKLEEIGDPTKSDWNQAKDVKVSPQWARWSVEQRRRWVTDRFEQIARTRWRCIILHVKSKLEMIAIGLSTAEREFLADMVLADGRTVHAAIREGIKEQYLTGKPIGLLGTGGAS